jgi:hypothetical protein
MGRKIFEACKVAHTASTVIMSTLQCPHLLAGTQGERQRRNLLPELKPDGLAHCHIYPLCNCFMVYILLCVSE